MKFHVKFEVLLQKQFFSKWNSRKRIAESKETHQVYSTEILLYTATIREVNLTEIDSFTVRVTQDYMPLLRQATNNQANSRNFKTLSLIYLQ